MGVIMLTSAGTRVKRAIEQILPVAADLVEMAYVATASSEEPDPHFEQDRKELQGMGFRIEDVDIAGRTENDLRAILGGKDVIYVQGGNTFFLLKWVRDSGFDKVVKDLIEKGTIYIGVSAGSYICCPTIEMATWKPNSRPRHGVTDLTAMGLVPFLVSAHYKPEERELLKSCAERSAYPLHVLTNSQAIIMRDNEFEFVGGPEIIL